VQFMTRWTCQRLRLGEAYRSVRSRRGSHGGTPSRTGVWSTSGLVWVIRIAAGPLLTLIARRSAGVVCWTVLSHNRSRERGSDGDGRSATIAGFMLILRTSISLQLETVFPTNTIRPHPGCEKIFGTVKIRFDTVSRNLDVARVALV